MNQAPNKPTIDGLAITSIAPDDLAFRTILVILGVQLMSSFVSGNYRLVIMDPFPSQRRGDEEVVVRGRLHPARGEFSDGRADIPHHR